ncbi:MFS transporter [Phycicoccus flavus]|uniref:MFS transporter n=1 Tax=Phycicoccus flavus TaxID=2502783 RepID=A0A8T6QZX6_9MICO|nr:MFS transporter [Phycicoccus flavus]NHA66824.1 MFS transporter [Phycicoccus flavus]
MTVDTGPGPAPTSAVRSAFTDAWTSLRSVFANPSLRRIQLALAGSMIGDWAYSTAVVVWAYGAGGAKLIGAWGAIRLVLMAVTSPVAAGLADRLPRKTVLVGADIARAVLVAVATVMLVAGSPTLAILVVATLVSLVGCLFRPAQMAWLPSLTEEPAELTAANGAASTIESLAFFLGPAIGALLVSVTNVETVFVLNAVTYLWSALLILGIRPRRATAAETGDDGEEAGGGMWSEMAGGFVHIARNRELVMVAVLTSTQTLVAGATIVLGVVFAVDILRTGPEGVGVIDSAFGVGAIVGGFVAITRAARNRIAGDLAVGTALWSLPLLLVVAFPSPATVFAAVVLLGLGNPLVDVNFATIVQRLTPDAVLGRVFGAFEGLLIGTMALGSAVTPLLISGFGLRWALVVLALVVGVPALLFLPRCLRLDATLRPPEGADLLRTVPIFAPMSPSALEALARGAVRRQVPAGTTVVREGEESDLFYVIDTGRVTVTQEGRHLREEGPGDFFGEIGLLQDVRRTATITALEDTGLFAISREDFLDAVRGTEESMTVANDVVVRRLGRA